MGRLKLTIANVRRFAWLWLPPMVIAASLLVGVNGIVRADPLPSADELAAYLQDNELNVSTGVTDDYQQVYFRYNDKTVFLTNTGYNHTHAVSSGQYVAWEGLIDGSSQIFLYDVLTGAETQITTKGNNQTPFIFQNTITWQTWDGDDWQIRYYDGLNVRQITGGSTSSVYASTNGQQILYAEQLDTDLWKAQSYDISTGDVTTIREGDTVSTAYPHFTTDGITTVFVPQ